LSVNDQRNDEEAVVANHQAKPRQYGRSKSLDSLKRTKNADINANTNENFSLNKVTCITKITRLKPFQSKKEECEESQCDNNSHNEKEELGNYTAVVTIEMIRRSLLNLAELTSKLGVSCLQRIDESELDVDDEESSMSNDACSEHNTTTNMNETIIQSIRNPFSYEIKNRLLRRCGGVDYLKTKSTYTSLMSNAPIIKEKRNVFLAGNTNYSVIKEIGKGSYAVIYAISNKNETCALKVNFLLFCLF